VFGWTPLAELVAQDQEESDRIARTVLGPVLELPADERKVLIDTARAWFDCGGSAERAAQAAYCHPNTVRYRLRRLQELTGRSLAEPWAVAELAAALQAVLLRRRRRTTHR
jgi:DNA-binding PucR family transcriptional regulator